MIPLSDQQRLFLVESDQLYRAWREVAWRHNEHKYGMRWKNVNDTDYLLRMTTASGNSKSLGARSPKLNSFMTNLRPGKNLPKKNTRV